MLVEFTQDDPVRQTVWVRELAQMRINDIRHELPNPLGLCAANLEVYIDQRGVYSSGYVLHAHDHSICEHAGENWYSDTPEIAALKSEWSNLKKLLDETSTTD